MWCARVYACVWEKWKGERGDGKKDESRQRKRVRAEGVVFCFWVHVAPRTLAFT